MVVGLVFSLLEFIENKRKVHENILEKRNLIVHIILWVSSISAILFVVVGIIFLYFLLTFTVAEPLLSNLLSMISLWPVGSGCLLLLSVQCKIKAISQPRLQTKSTILLTLTIISIVLYYCFYGAVLYYIHINAEI